MIRNALSSADREYNHAAISTHPYPQEGGKCDRLDPLAPGCHSQPERDSGLHSQKQGYPDVHLSPQEEASIYDSPSQPGVSSQPDTHFSQQQGESNDDITYQQQGGPPKPIMILSDQQVERDTVQRGDEDTAKSQLPPPPTRYPRPTHPPPTWYPRLTHCPYLEQLDQNIADTQIRFRISSRKKQEIEKLLMAMLSIFQDTIRQNERETGDGITG